MAKPFGTRTPWADSAEYISPREAFLPPTSGTSVLRSSLNQRMQGDAVISISPTECSRCRAELPGAGVVRHSDMYVPERGTHAISITRALRLERGDRCGRAQQRQSAAGHDTLYDCSLRRADGIIERFLLRLHLGL